MGNSLNSGSRPWDWKTTHDENAMVWKSGCNHKAARYFNERRSWKSSKKIGRKVVSTCSKHLKTYAHGKSWKEQSQLKFGQVDGKMSFVWMKRPRFKATTWKSCLLKDMCMCVKRKTCSMEIWGSAPESIRTPQWAAEEIAGAGGQAGCLDLSFRPSFAFHPFLWANFMWPL